MTISEYPVVEGSGGITPDRQVFAQGGTWIKPTGAQVVRVQLLGAGSGGGGGAKATATGGRPSGGGGSAGTYVEAWYRASDLPGTVAIVVGTGGTGGAATTSDNGAGGTGSMGGNTDFGTLLRGAAATGPTSPSGMFGPGQGGGQTANVFGQGGHANLGDTGAQTQASAAGDGSGNTTAAATRNNGQPNQPVGGVAGQGFASVSSIIGGSFPGWNNLCFDEPTNVSLSATLPAAPGYNALAVTAPKSLADSLYQAIPYYGGGGGGAATGTASTTGGNGADAAGYGAGGGGGGGATNGGSVPSGVGGRGAPGLAIVTSF